MLTKLNVLNMSLMAVLLVAAISVSADGSATVLQDVVMLAP